MITYAALIALTIALAASVAVRKLRQRAEAEYRRSLQRQRELLWQALEGFNE